MVVNFDKLAGRSILSELQQRDVKSAGKKAGAEQFVCKLEGELAPEDDYWDVVAEVADWVIEIDATARKVRYAVIPTRRNAKELGAKGVQVRRCEVADDHPEPELGPFFQARILVREGSPTVDRARRAWLGRMSNVWVFMEGFRVLPYGEPTDDWLGIDAALARRERS